MEITVAQMRNVEFRKERLLSKTKRLEYLLSGRSRSLLPEVQTKEGKHSEEKTWQFIGRLIEALEKYEKCHLCDEDDELIEEVDYEMPKAQKAFYECFLYCAIRVAEENPWWVLMTRGSFDDILKLAEQTQYYDDKYELFFQESYKEGEIEGFFFCMDELYKAFMGKEITSTIGEKDLNEMKKRYSYELEMMEFADSDYWEAYYEQFGDMSEEEQAEAQWKSMSPAERKIALKRAEEKEKREQRKKEWIEKFEEKTLFCEKYEQCRELYFQVVVRPRDLTHKIERMMDVYLYEQKDSSFMDDDIFFYTYALLEQAIGQVNELLIEGV